MKPDHTFSPTPSIWVLVDERAGNSTQSLGLADALGWPYQVKQLRFSRIAKLHNFHDRLLGATTISLDRKKSDPLIPPFPDIVIAAGKRLVPISRWIRKQSQGRTRLVQLGRKGGQVAELFDVVITPSYCRFLPHPRRIETMAPLNRVTDTRIQSAAEKWRDLFDGKSRPRIVLLVGGSTVRYQFDVDIASKMAHDVRALANEFGGTVYAVTSRRTGPMQTKALKSAIEPSGVVFQWEAGKEKNPYWGCLALADIIVVTGESESMVSEAVSIGKPVYIYSLPERPTKISGRASEAIARWAHRQSSASANGRIVDRITEFWGVCLMEKGILRPLRDLEAMHDVLFQRGLAYPFGDTRKPLEHPPLREAVEVATKVKHLLGYSL